MALSNPEQAPVLHRLDTVRIFSRYDFREVPAVNVGGEVWKPGAYQTSGQVHLRDAVHLAGGITPDASLEYAQVIRRLPDSKLRIISVNLGKALAGDPIDNILLEPRDRVLVHPNPAKVDPPTIFINGAVAKPGRYPLTTNLRLSDLIRLGGGLKRSAFTEGADLTRYLSPDGRQEGEHREINIAAALAGDPAHDLPLRDGDTLAIRQIPGWKDIGAQVSVQGEAAHPGTYGIQPGERLSSVLKRAGGFLPTAYPRGAVLVREEVREIQELSKQELIARVEAEATNVRVAIDAAPEEQAALLQAAAQQRVQVLTALKNAPITGRLVINLYPDLSKFESSPDDIELRNGDRLILPKRPDFVVVTGQVYNSNAITFTPRKNAEWYVKQAGGLTELGNKDTIFIVRANGSVVSGSGASWWGGGVLSTRVQPGDMIVVPEKPIGNSIAWKDFLSVAQIATQSALTAGVLIR